MTSILGFRNYSFVKNINDHIKNDKRDLIIIDREYKYKKRKDGYIKKNGTNIDAINILIRTGLLRGLY
jgi:hypothetical protein